MSLDKAIKYGKEKRKPYRRGKAIDTACRNHGECSYCRDNRLHKYKRELARLQFELDDFIELSTWYSQQWNWKDCLYEQDY